MTVWKSAGSIGSAPSDPVKDQTALAPIPTPAIENKPAPGQTGPKGMSPRTTYSKVNTGSPPTMDAGAMSQKGSPNRGMEFLPAKVAEQRGSMTTMHVRPSLQDMVKAAMAGAADSLAVNLEASRQATGKTVKTATKTEDPTHIPTETISKLASALNYIGETLLKEAEGEGPGTGPGALAVSQATESGTPLSGGSGEATSKNQPPMNPSLQPDKVQEGNAGTGLQTNDDAMPTMENAGIKNASALGKAMAARDAAKGAAGKVVSAVKNHKDGLSAAALGATAGGAGYAAGRLHAHAKEHEKKASSPVALIRQLTKKAEDAINPAQISAEKGQDPMKPPEGASASGEGVPSEPSDVNSQKGMIASNEAAINYTKGQAKADPKRDLAQVLTEPALSSAHDKVLNEVFDNTGKAGVKISSANTLRKTAAQVGAQRILLNDLLKKAAQASQMGR